MLFYSDHLMVLKKGGCYGFELSKLKTVCILFTKNVLYCYFSKLLTLKTFQTIKINYL